MPAALDVVPVMDPKPSATPDADRASDLAEGELGVAAWFDHLARVDAPEGLRSRILAASAASVPPAGRLLRLPLGRVPFGAWGLASAALLLLALGAAVAVELFDPVQAPAAPVDARAEARAAADRALAQRIRNPAAQQDDNLALYHGVETFDEVGLAPGELIADWGR